ncbi:DNA transposase [Frankliniella fusca]|uniref:DNA transposase n=1 Tax=Frankliniella fusca TaxID=407009 RepID=A0AAE1L619_9NEOP|nr:DNA transposase [Frankliniella fusca]
MVKTAAGTEEGDVVVKPMVNQYKEEIKQTLLKCSAKSKEVIDEAIKNLPPVQQEAVRVCFEAARRKTPCGRRYTIQWVYECMLIIIKSPDLYKHILEREILPMPSNTTIRGYLKKYRGAYGFQPATFHLLEKKAEELETEPNKRRGVLLLDEIKLPAGLYFDENSLKVAGFKDLGGGLAELGQDLEDQYEEACQRLPQENPKQEQKDARRAKQNEKNDKKRDKNLADHALVITFQPLQGTRVQNTACFLSKGAADDASAAARAARQRPAAEPRGSSLRPAGGPKQSLQVL